ncbi:MAG: Signal peptidase, partial [Verrucomicrobiota bacterium]
MFFLTPRYRKEGKLVLRAARKLIRYRCDVLPEQQIVGLREGCTRLEVALRKRSREDIVNSTQKLHGLFDQAAPPPPLAGLRENTEVILVALVVALGVRAYFLQPFKIPTGS